jgi:hypothetical protein
MDLLLVGQGLVMIAFGMMVDQRTTGWGGDRIELRWGKVFILPGVFLGIAGILPQLQESRAFLIIGGIVMGSILVWASINALISVRSLRQRMENEAARLEDSVAKHP